MTLARIDNKTSRRKLDGLVMSTSAFLFALRDSDSFNPRLRNDDVWPTYVVGFANRARSVGDVGVQLARSHRAPAVGS